MANRVMTSTGNPGVASWFEKDIDPAALQQVFATAGTFTWTKPEGISVVRVFSINGGGGGASGAKQAAGVAAQGGGGGAAGILSVFEFLAANVGVTEIVTVGAGGVGGAGVTANSTAQNQASQGSLSTVGTLLAPVLGSPTGTGSTHIGESAQFGLILRVGQSQGAAGANAKSDGTVGSAGNDGAITDEGAGAGGSGGGVTAGDVASAGGLGGKVNFSQYLRNGVAFVDAPAGTSGGGDGTDGESWAAGVPQPGAGGAGGGSSIAGDGGDGGNGGLYGGGGGGGGGARNDTGNSGAGGNGADGIVVITCW